MGWGCARGQEGTQPGQLTPADQRDIPCYMMSRSAYKVGEDEGVGKCLEWWHLHSQVTVTRDGAVFSRRWRNSCLQMGSSKGVSYFALLVHVVFALPIQLSSSQPTSFLTFTIPILSAIPRRGGA